MLIRQCLRRDGGAAAVELALLLPLLVMLVFGIVQFGSAYNRQQGMQAAVREGGRLASATTGTPITADLIEIRVENSLQGNGGGSGFPAPGGTVTSDIEVEITNLTGPADNSSTAIPDGDEATTTVCDGHHSVKVVAYVTPSRRDAYGLVLPLVPGSPFELPMAAQAIFRCLNP